MLLLTQKNHLAKPLSILLGFTMLFMSICFSQPEKAYAAAPAYGQLKVVGSQLCNSSGQPVQLKGMSSHGLQWYGQFMNSSSINYLKSNWGANVVRAAMYTAENGYISNPSTATAKVDEIVNAAINAGIYVIIDWHILSDNNPNTYKTQAKAFFEDMARKYGSYPNVIYEICNEPNGVTWSGDIKPYANYIIPAIRAIDPDNIIIVGTSTWSQDVDIASQDPLSYSNIAYTCHFYSGTHTQSLRDKISRAMANGIAVFVTEWGTSDASGNGGPYLDEAQTWINFMADNKISWCNWSLCDKAETSAALAAGASTTGGWADANLTASGKFVKSNMNPSSQPTPTSTPAPTPTAAPTQPTPTPGAATPSPTPTPTSTSSTQQGIDVTYSIDNSWNDGATITVTIKNNTSAAINGWSLAWSFPGNQTVSNMWNASYTQSGSTVTVTNLEYNNVIAGNGGTASIGFNINYSGSNNKPASFTLNGTACQVK